MSDNELSAAKLAANLMMVQCTAQVVKDRNVSFAVNVDRMCPQKELDDAMDKMRLAIERQQKFSSIEAAIKDIANLEAQIYATGSEIEKNDQVYSAKMSDGSQRRGDYHGMTKEQENMRRQQVSSIDGMRKQIDMLQHRLNELRLEVNHQLMVPIEAKYIEQAAE